MRIAMNDIVEITTDTTSDDVNDHGMTIILNSGHAILTPFQTELVLLIKLEHPNEQSDDWEYYVSFEI